MSGMEKRKKYYLDALRVAAVLLVMYNHSPAYLSFQVQSGVEFEISMFLSMVCKIAVPVFFMISGALLLGKTESFSDLFRKRIVRCVLALAVFSFLYKLKMAVKGAASFSLLSFILLLPREVAFLPYWYLYSYLGFLLLLPILRPLAQNMDRKTFQYLILLQIVFGCVFPVLGNLKQWWLCGYLSVSPILADLLFYPLVGYGIDRFVTEEEFRNWKGVFVNTALLISFYFTRKLVLKDYAQTGAYGELFLGFLTAIPAMLLFLDCRTLISEKWMPGWLKKLLPFVGDMVFGIYLLDGFIGTGGKMDIIFRALSPFVGFLPAYILEILVVFVIRLILVAILKKLPLMKMIL